MTERLKPRVHAGQLVKINNVNVAHHMGHEIAFYIMSWNNMAYSSIKISH